MRVETLGLRSMPFHLNVPRPNPDELLYSVAARFAHHHGLREAKTLSQALLGLPSVVIPTLLPAHFGRLRWLIETRWRMTVHDVALDHTLLPFFLSADGPAKARRAALVASVGEDQASHLEQTLGIAASRVAKPRHLRYCAACAREERARAGEAYWHRAHQLPGVLVCPDHGTPLSVSEAPVAPVVRSAPLAAEQIIQPDRDPVEPVSAAARPVAWQIARYCQQGLDGASVGLPQLQVQVEVAGFGRRHGTLQELHERFESFVGRELLESIEPGWNPGEPLSWVMHIRRKPRKVLHPTRFHLMRLFLDSLRALPAPSPFGTGPWPCPNWLAPHFGERVVEDMTLVIDRRHPERVIGRFACSCGMNFTRFAQDPPDRRSIRIRAFGHLFSNRAAELAAKGLSVAAIAAALKVHWKTAKRLMDEPVGAKPETADQLRWSKLVAQYPGKGVSYLRNLEPALYARIYRRDRQWLRRHTPRPKRTRLAPARVDWEARDQEWAAIIEAETARLLANEPRRRVTRTAVVKRLGVQATVEKRLGQLPKTAAALTRVCETREQFRARRLEEVAAEAPFPRPLWLLARKAGLRPELITEDVLRLARLPHLKEG